MKVLNTYEEPKNCRFCGAQNAQRYSLAGNVCADCLRELGRMYDSWEEKNPGNTMSAKERITIYHELQQRVMNAEVKQ